MISLLCPAVAHADASSWLFVGGGTSRVDVHASQVSSAVMRLDAGVGTKPSWPVMVGIGGRFVPYFEKGVDWAAYVRVATRSYVTGWWGAAVDGGGYARKWGGESTGYLASLNLGAPWGFVLTGNFDRGTEGHQTVSVLAGIDFLRLTVYRLAGEAEWPNPNPAWRPGETTPRLKRNEPESQVKVEGCAEQAAATSSVVSTPSGSVGMTF